MKSVSFNLHHQCWKAKIALQLFVSILLTLLIFLLGWQNSAFAASPPINRDSANSGTEAVPGAPAASGVSAASGVTAASAQVEPGEKVAPEPSDKGDWKGDVILLANDVTDIKSTNTETAAKKDFFAPDGAIFTVVDDNAKTHKIIVKFRNILTPKQTNEVLLDVTVGWFHYKTTEIERRVDNGGESVNSHDLYVLDKAVVEKMDYYRHGWAFGVLAVPYKYQISDKSFGSALSVGPYLGYRQEDRGSSLTYLVSAGFVNNIPVALANNAGTVNRSGFSIATGVIFSVDKGSGMQVGLLAGQDTLGSNAAAPYPYEGKTWLSVAVGYKFF